MFKIFVGLERGRRMPKGMKLMNSEVSVEPKVPCGINFVNVKFFLNFIFKWVLLSLSLTLLYTCADLKEWEKVFPHFALISLIEMLFDWSLYLQMTF